MTLIILWFLSQNRTFDNLFEKIPLLKFKLRYALSEITVPMSSNDTAKACTETI